jgi:hypothetical protein
LGESQERAKPSLVSAASGLTFQGGACTLKKEARPTNSIQKNTRSGGLGDCRRLHALIAENRILVKKGLEQLAVTKWQGIETLGAKSWSQSTVGNFRMSGSSWDPVSNAAGRLGEAKRTFHLLM